VVLGRDVGRPGEHVEVLTLDRLPDAAIDMRTVIVVGSSTTRMLADRPLSARVYTPRWYGDPEDQNPTAPSNHATA
jgi:cobalt-precorrin 5A hydrolase/precorrin-3B C17-methyltransferase